jgi:hypothetical protein
VGLKGSRIPFLEAWQCSLEGIATFAASGQVLRIGGESILLVREGEPRWTELKIFMQVE